MIDKELVVYSAPRTGSTLIWQCCKEIFNKVHKAHHDNVFEYLQAKLPCIITERERVDAFLSRERVLRFSDYSKKQFEGVVNDRLQHCIENNHQAIDDDIEDYILELDSVEYVKNCYVGDLLVLKYEDFYENYDYIFTQLEDFFSISIPFDRKQNIVKKTSKSHNINIQNKMDSFFECDKSSNIHGNHIQFGDVNYSSKLLNDFNYHYLYTHLYRCPDSWKTRYNIK